MDYTFTKSEELIFSPIQSFLNAPVIVKYSNQLNTHPHLLDDCLVLVLLITSLDCLVGQVLNYLGIHYFFTLMLYSHEVIMLHKFDRIASEKKKLFFCLVKK